MNKVLGLLLISSLFLFGCVGYGSQPDKTSTPPAQVVVGSSNSSGANNAIVSQAGGNVTADSQSSQPASQLTNANGAQEPAVQPPASPELKEFNLTARQWQFEPSTITVKKGDHVKLHVTSIDTTHGFSIMEFNVNSQLTTGQTTTVEFTPDRTGSFNFFCSVFCGSGHGGMKGTLVVTD